MKKMILSLVLAMTLAACGQSAAPKFLVILQAGTESHEGMARALHALLYSQELMDAGYEVALVFDGAGTTWAKELRDPANKLHGAYKKLSDAGATQIICDYCASAFKVHEQVKAGPVPLAGEFQGHPSLVKWVKQGYQLVVL